MLVLSRKLNEKILLPGTSTAIQVVAIQAGKVRLGIEAPPDVVVLRAEVPDKTTEWGARPKPAPRTDADKLRAVGTLAANRLNLARAELAVLRRQLQDGLVREAETTLDKLDDDMRSLRQRMENETDRRSSVPSPPKTR